MNRTRLNRDKRSNRSVKLELACTKRGQALFEALEPRTLFSSGVLAAEVKHSTHKAAVHAAVTLTPTFVNDGAVVASASGSTLSAPFTPAQIQQAYGISNISYSATAGNGSGQTIAIIDAYNDPDILSDAATFDTQFGLQQFNGASGPTLTVLGQSGSATLPTNATKGGWDVEESLDVEWAHAVAPDANIVLFEASSDSTTDLFAAAKTAASYGGVSVVSMSFGASEYGGENGSDSTFLTPGGHQGVTFLASTGDDGAGVEYPAASPDVVAVGGTSLTINADGSYGGESAWSDGGGGISAYEPQPGYQVGKVNGLTTGKRAIPDISLDANPSTGVYVVDTYDNSSDLEVGGTSLACPLAAGLISIADEGRTLQGLSTLNGVTQTLPDLYTLSSSDYHDITTGSDGNPATTGYDLATGLGSPVANLFVPALAGYSVAASQLAFTQQPTNTTAGIPLSPAVVVDVENATGSVDTVDGSTVTLSILSGPAGGTITGTASAAAVNGVATFSGLSFTVAGNYTLSATDGSLTAATSSSFTVTAAAAAKMVFIQQPTSTPADAVISPAITVAMEDAYGNLIIRDTSTVTLSIASGPGAISGTTTATVVGGIATFSNVVLPIAGTYTLAAADGSLMSATSTAFTVTAIATALTLTANSSTTSNATQSLTFTAAVSGGVPNGEGVTLEDASANNAVVAAAVLSGGTATFTVPAGSLLGGTHSLVAVYAGDGTFAPSQSNAITQTVQVVVTGVAVNGNNAALAGVQRSMVDGVLYTFSEPVAIGASGFGIALHAGDGGTVPTLNVTALNPSGGGLSTQWVVSFGGAGVVGASIADGVYDLTLAAGAAANAAKVTNSAASTTTFDRLFGDLNGDGVVNNADYARFGRAFGSTAGSSTYQAAFDYDGNGSINNLDYAQFGRRFGLSLVF